MRASVARARKVARKPPGYIARRLAQEILREVHRGTLRAARGGRGHLVPRRVLADGQALRRTEQGVRDLGAWAAAIEAVRADAELHSGVIRRAQRAERREVELFGDEPIMAGIPPRWNEDVSTGLGWPLAHYRAIDYRNPHRPSDVKVAWELSRLRHLVHLAQGAAVADDHGWQASIDADFRDWLRANPLGRSVNWASPMEVGLRAVNLICVDGILLGGGRVLSSRPLLVASLYQHGWFLARNLEISDVNGNHYLADATCLLWLGRYFHGFGEAERWSRRGLTMVLEAARNQVLADGVDHEGSLPYHVLVLELFLMARRAAPEDLAVADGILEPMLGALCSLAGPAGRVPNMGDDDGGRAIALCDAPSDDARRVLALGAAILGHPWAAARADGGSWDDALWLCGPEVVHAARPGSVPPHRRRRFDDAGLVVLGEGADHVVLDAGTVGFRGHGGHGHLDAMSYEAMLAGRFAVRDSGTGSYTGNTRLRECLRDAAAHSLVLVDDLRYAQLGGTEQLWNITGDSPPTVREVSIEPGSHRVVAEQDLPAKAGTARHRRTLTWSPQRLRCDDEVYAPAGAQVELYVQLPARCTIDGLTVVGDGFVYRFEVPDGASLRLEHDAPWSQRYGSVGRGCRAVVSSTAPGGALSFGMTVQINK